MSSDGIGEDRLCRKNSSQCTVRRICEALDSILALYLVPGSLSFFTSQCFSLGVIFDCAVAIFP